MSIQEVISAWRDRLYRRLSETVLSVALIAVVGSAFVWLDPVHAQTPEPPKVGMISGNAQRTRVFQAKPLLDPTTIAWRTSRMFVLGKPGIAIVFGPFGSPTTMSGSTITSSGHGFSEMVVFGDTIYFTVFINDTYVIAQDRLTGKDKWRFKVRQRASSVLIVDDTLYFNTGNDLYALDANTGKEKWKQNRKGQIEYALSPLFGENKLFFVNVEFGGHYPNRPDGRLIAADLNGKELWVFKTKGNLGAPAYWNNTVFIGDDQGYLRAIDAAGGRELWRTEITEAVSAPVIDAGIVYVTGSDGSFHAMDASSGKRVWKQDRLPKPATGLSVIGGVGYYCGRDRDLYAINLNDASLKWTYDTKTQCRAPVVAAAGIIYISTRAEVHAVDAGTGRGRWAMGDVGEWLSSPSIADEIVYVLNAEGRLYALK